MFKRMFSHKSKAAKDVGTMPTVDLSSSLAQAQDLLGKLRRGEAGPDPFPSLNEASRIVTQLANQVENLDPNDAIKEVWNEQIAEVQRELQIVTDRTLEKVPAKSNEPIHGDPGAVFDKDSSDDLFSGLTMTPATPPNPQPSEALPTVNSGRVELDSALFSDLSGLEETKSTQADSAESTPKLSKIPTSPSTRIRSPDSRVDTPVSVRSASVSVRAASPNEKGLSGAIQQNNRGTSGVPASKKKKKASHLGYGREPELSPSGRPKSSTRTESVGSWVEVKSASQITDAPSSEGSGIGAFSSPRSESDGKRSIPAAPAISLIPSNLDGGGISAQNIKLLGREISGKITLEAVLHKAKRCNSSLSEAFAELSDKEKKLLSERTRLLTQFAEGKGRVADLEAKQAGAVEQEDFDNAARLAVEIDSQLAQLDSFDKDLLSMDRSIRKCGSERLAAMQKSMQMFNVVISEVNDLRIECEGVCSESQEEKKQELAVLEADMNEKAKIIKEIEACIPEEKAGIAKCRSVIMESNQKRQEDKENTLIALRKHEGQLKAEIELLKMDLASKESLLGSVVQDIEKTENEDDEDFKVGMVQLKNRETLLAKEENRLEVMRSKRDAVAKKCEQSKDSSAKLQKQHEEQLSKVRSACATFEEEIESLSKDVQRDKECGEILAKLAADKSEADERKSELQKQRKQERDELKNLGLKIVDFRTSIRGLEEEIAKEEARLPQIEDLKTAAAMAKDFTEAAALSTEAKEAVKRREDAQAKLLVSKAQLRDSEEQQTKKTERVASVKSDLVKAMKQSALTHYTQLIVDLRLTSLGIASRTAEATAAVEKVCDTLAREHGFTEDMVDGVLKQIEKLA